MTQEKLKGEALLQMFLKLSFANLSRIKIAIQCGYYTSTTAEDGKTAVKADLDAFYDAVLEAKGISRDY